MEQEKVKKKTTKKKTRKKPFFTLTRERWFFIIIILTSFIGTILLLELDESDYLNEHIYILSQNIFRDNSI